MWAGLAGFLVGLVLFGLGLALGLAAGAVRARDAVSRWVRNRACYLCQERYNDPLHRLLDHDD